MSVVYFGLEVDLLVFAVEDEEVRAALDAEGVVAGEAVLPLLLMFLF